MFASVTVRCLATHDIAIDMPFGLKGLAGDGYQTVVFELPSLHCREVDSVMLFGLPFGILK